MYIRINNLFVDRNPIFFPGKKLHMADVDVFKLVPNPGTQLKTKKVYTIRVYGPAAIQVCEKVYPGMKIAAEGAFKCKNKRITFHALVMWFNL